MDKDNELEDFLDWERQWGDPETALPPIEKPDTHDEWKDLQ